MSRNAKQPAKRGVKPRGESDRRAAFATAYMGDAKMNATEAARLAGYAPKHAASEGSRLMKDPTVAASIDRMKAERASKSAVTLASITASLLEMSEGRTLATVGVSEGAPILGEPKHSDRLKATELLARLHGLDRHQVDLTIVPATAEALRRAAEARERVELLEQQAAEAEEG